MSELSNFRKKLLSHQVLLEGVPLAYQLGIPKLHVEHGQLCASFFPHKVTTKENQWEWNDPAFQLTCKYPSCKIVYFANLKYEKTLIKRDGEPLLVTSICTSEPHIRQLEKLCSDTMLAWIENRNSEDIIYFEKVRKHVADQLGLSALWGE